MFGLFRSWHNSRALDPTSPLNRLTLAIAYATEAHLFITDLNQSPFNLSSLTKDPEMTENVRGMLRGQPCSSSESFYRLRTGGLIAGNTPADAQFRCQLYAVNLAQHLL